MQNVELRQLTFSPKYKAHLLKAQYTTAAEVLVTPQNLLRQRTALSPTDITQLVAELSQAVLSRDEARCIYIAELVADRSVGRISFGDAGLDQLFGGGVRVGNVTEIAGQSASGKTHLCLQLALQVQLPVSQGGLSGGALFISSEGTLSSTRLLSLATHLVEAATDEPDRIRPPPHPRIAPSRPLNEWDFLDNVHTEKSPDVDTLEAVLAYHAPAAIERINELAATRTLDPDLASLTGMHNGDELVASQFLTENRKTSPLPPLPIRLVILDSIAAPLRAAHETGSSGFVERSKELVSIADRLHRIAHVYHCAVVVVNQVQDVFDRSGPLPPHLVESPPLRSDSSTSGQHTPTAQTHPSASCLSMPPPPPPAPPPLLSSANYRPPAASNFATPSTLSRTSTTSSSSSIYSQYSTVALPPPHVQYSLPSLLYTRFQSPHSSGASALPPSRYSPTVSAALGTTWTNLINTRVSCMISRRGGGGGNEDAKREMNIVFTPEVKRAKIEYELRSEGVRSVGPVEYREETWVEDEQQEEEERDFRGMQVDVEEEDEEAFVDKDWERAAILIEEDATGGSTPVSVH